MSAQLAQAAQAVIDRWDSPKWEWISHGPTADLIADLRKALAAFEAAPQQDPVAWQVWWGLGKMRLNSVHIEKATADEVASRIRSYTEVRPVYAAPQHAGRADAQPVDKLDALQLDLARARDAANGFVDEIKRLKQQVRELEAFRAMVNRHQPEFPADPDGPRDVWYWQGDHMDRLESMVHTLPVVIRAEQLRELLAARAEKGGT